MHPDALRLLAFLAGCCGLVGLAAWKGTDREAGRMLMVIAAIVLLLAALLVYLTGR